MLWTMLLIVLCLCEILVEWSRMKYTVKRETVEGCECEDCRAGRHIYSLYRWRENEWRWVGTSLQSHVSAEECKRKHLWFIHFEPDAIWEDGQPVVEPEPMQADPPVQAQSGNGDMVPLDINALQKSFGSLKRHFGQMRRDE
jgi:hypothetical protein